MDYKERLTKIKQSKKVNSDHIKSVQTDITALLTDVEEILREKEIQLDHKKILEDQRDKLLNINESLDEVPAKISDSIDKALNLIVEANHINLNEIITKIEAIKPVVTVKSPIVPEPTVIKEDDIFSIYKPADTDEQESVKYYGYLAKDGSWFIMRESGSDERKRYRYASGKGNFEESFNNRKKIDYDYIDKVVL